MIQLNTCQRSFWHPTIRCNMTAGRAETVRPTLLWGFFLVGVVFFFGIAYPYLKLSDSWENKTLHAPLYIAESCSQQMCLLLRILTPSRNPMGCSPLQLRFPILCSYTKMCVCCWYLYRGIQTVARRNWCPRESITLSPHCLTSSRGGWTLRRWVVMVVTHLARAHVAHCQTLWRLLYVESVINVTCFFVYFFKQ